MQRLPAVNILNHDDRIIDQNANRKNQRKKRHAVQRKAPRPRGEECRREGERDRDADDQRLALAERKKDQQHDESGCKNEFANQLLRLVSRGFAVVSRHRNFNAVRNNASFE